MTMKKVLLAVAVAAMMVASQAGAADKLIVQDATGTNTVFKVDDAGTVTGVKLGMGTSTPQVPLHLNINTTFGVGTSLYDPSSGLAVTRGDGSAAADLITADSTAIAGKRPIMRGIRARGSLVSPTAPAVNDQVFSLLGAVWTGARVYNTADITMKVDGTISDLGLVADPTGASISAPARITFSTRSGLTWTERMTVKSDGKVGINQPSPTSILHVSGLVTYTSNANAIAAGLTAGAFYTDGVGNVKVVY
jgi:hypothetical protein